jgi:hypothetical protein
MEYAPTSHNTRYTLRRGQAPPPGSVLARSVRRGAPSLPRPNSATFPPARVAGGDVVYLKRYATYRLKLVKIMEKLYEKGFTKGKIYGLI